MAEKIAKAAKELVEHLQIIENIRSLQTSQKALADEIRGINERLFELQAEIRALKSETKFECLRETQQIVNAVQGGLNQRLKTLSNKMAVLEAGHADAIIGSRTSPTERLEPPGGAKARRGRAPRKS